MATGTCKICKYVTHTLKFNYSFYALINYYTDYIYIHMSLLSAVKNCLRISFCTRPTKGYLASIFVVI